MSKSEMELTAYRYFLRETKLGAFWRDDYMRGWLAGYQAYFDGIA